MMIKPDIQGYLIYLTMVGYLCVLCTAIKYPKLAKGLFVGSFFFGLAALVYRWNAVQHLPMQNMFEVFLVLGVLIWPIHLLSKRILGRDHPGYIVIDAAIGLVVLFPAGFVFNHQPQFLPPALQFWLFGPHVAAYMLAYIFMAKAAVFAVGGIVVPPSKKELNTTMADSGYRLVAMGFGLLTLGLFLGSIWGKYAWGDWWGWDPKELWSLVCWLVYAIYLHARFAWPKRFRIHHALNILGLICIVITLLWVNLSKLFSGLHNYAS
jgi:ABC-type transport system involved in cytochrome c biogenesis permease subunit